MIFYISDLHLGDQRIFDLCKRPFNSLKEYEKELIKRWNAKVSKNDHVYVLGDLATGSAKDVKHFFSRVNGHKHFIVGNHDEGFVINYLLTKSFATVNKISFIDDNGRKVCVCHYPIMDWMFGDQKIYHVYGHIHNKTAENNGYMYEEIRNYYKNKPAYNAGVDVTNFEPVTLDELIEIKEVSNYETHLN